MLLNNSYMIVLIFFVGNSIPTVEVNTARNKLDDILQTLVEKIDDR